MFVSLALLKSSSFVQKTVVDIQLRKRRVGRTRTVYGKYQLFAVNGDELFMRLSVSAGLLADDAALGLRTKAVILFRNGEVNTEVENFRIEI